MQEEENDMKNVQEEDEVLGEESDNEFNRGKDAGIDCSRVWAGTWGRRKSRIGFLEVDGDQGRSRDEQGGRLVGVARGRNSPLGPDVI